MKNSISRSQKIGWIIFTIGALYMLGLGWLYSWWIVPAANQFGSAAYSGLLGFLWSLSVPVGAFIVAIGAALFARAERRLLWLLILLFLLIAIWKITYTSNQLVSVLFGAGSGLITMFLIRQLASRQSSAASQK